MQDLHGSQPIPLEVEGHSEYKNQTDANDLIPPNGDVTGDGEPFKKKEVDLCQENRDLLVVVRNEVNEIKEKLSQMDTTFVKEEHFVHCLKGTLSSVDNDVKGLRNIISSFNERLVEIEKKMNVVTCHKRGCQSDLIKHPIKKCEICKIPLCGIHMGNHFKLCERNNKLDEMAEHDIDEMEENARNKKILLNRRTSPKRKIPLPDEYEDEDEEDEGPPIDLGNTSDSDEDDYDEDEDDEYNPEPVNKRKAQYYTGESKRKIINLADEDDPVIVELNQSGEYEKRGVCVSDQTPRL